MIYNWYHSLLKHYKEGVDFSFNGDKLYSNIVWNTTPITLDALNELATQDTEETTLSEVRKQRNNLLQETDWRFRSDLNPSQAWKDYCQALRDITNDKSKWDVNSNGDVIVNWPTKPE